MRTYLYIINSYLKMQLKNILFIGIFSGMYGWLNLWENGINAENIIFISITFFYTIFAVMGTEVYCDQKSGFLQMMCAMPTMIKNYIRVHYIVMFGFVSFLWIVQGIAVWGHVMTWRTYLGLLLMETAIFLTTCISMATCYGQNRIFRLVSCFFQILIFCLIIFGEAFGFFDFQQWQSILSSLSFYGTLVVLALLIVLIVLLLKVLEKFSIQQFERGRI